MATGTMEKADQKLIVSYQQNLSGEVRMHHLSLSLAHKVQEKMRSSMFAQ